MSQRSTPLGLALAFLGAASLLLAVLFDRVELLVVAAPLLVPVMRAGFGQAPVRFRLTLSLSDDRASEGEQVRLSMKVAAMTDVPATEILHELPPLLEPVAGDHHAVVHLKSGETAEWSVDLLCRARGEVALGVFLIRRWHRSGAAIEEVLHRAPQRLKIYPRVVPLRRVPRPLKTRSSFGNHVAPKLGQGIEPGDIRAFAPGDRLRQINWQASLRFRRLYVTQFHEERAADIVLLLDTAGDVGRRPSSSLDISVRTAAALATAYLAQRDRVGLIKYSGSIEWIRPGSGRRQIEVLMEALMTSATNASYGFEDLDFVPPKVLPQGALVIAMSALVDGRFLKVVTELRARGFDVVLLALAPLSLMAGPPGPKGVDDLARRLWRVERQASLESLARRGLQVVEIEPDQPLDGVIAPLLRRRFRHGVRA
ncbi:MAG: DUF58 domain-containing protein [Proteobacteria bacterium]|nr:DUF58 domain-containing protein [Pseudomonadota bacterium]MBI3499365.1 DUF58 domain-containing protein [Pseudomonadota bacterium]